MHLYKRGTTCHAVAAREQDGLLWHSCAYSLNQLLCHWEGFSLTVSTLCDTDNLHCTPFLIRAETQPLVYRIQTHAYKPEKQHSGSTQH